MIKIATLEDLPGLLKVLKNFYVNSPFVSLTEFNEEIAAATAENIINGPKENGIILLYFKEDTIKGVLAGLAHKMLFSDTKVASELCWWVDEDARGIESLELIAAYEFWAQKVGCDLVTMANLTGDVGTRLDKYYKRRGYTSLETAYGKKV
jgi:hypothetical protein